MLAFANAVESEASDDEVSQARDRLTKMIGSEATRDAAATIAIFNGLVRVADGTGIQLDAGLFGASVDDRRRLGIDRFAGAANSADLAVDAADGPPAAVSDLFG